MKWKVPLGLVLLGLCGSASGIPVTGNLTGDFNALPKDCGDSPMFEVNSEDRIVGGRNVPHGRYPFIVSLRERDDDDFEHVCGASILSEHWILTAAHCPIYSKDPSMYEVAVGLNRLDEESDKYTKIHKVQTIKLHEEYKESNSMYNDIALLKVSKPIKFNSHVQAICLPTSKGDPEGYARVIGWGHTKEGGEMSNHLKEVTVPMVSRKTCFDAYDEDPDDGIDEITNDMICAGEKNKDACQFDSGGPLFQINKDKRYTQIGIVSFGRGCGAKYFPGVYTKVANYREWIVKNAK